MGRGGRRGGRACAATAVAGLLVVANVSAAAAAAPPKGAVHVVYIANSTVDQDRNTPDTGSTHANEKLTWNVSADVPLTAPSTVPYRYSQNFDGTVSGTGTYVHDNPSGGVAFTCEGDLTITPTNAEQAGTFEIDLVKSAGKLTSKATLGASSPVPVYTSDFATFGPDTGANCAGNPLLSSIENGPSPAGPHPIVLKLDLAKLAKAKGKMQTFKVGKTDDVTHGTTETKYSWNGTIALTLTK